MNFLQVCQRVFQECAVSGTLSSVAGVSGELKRIVDWTANAHNDICTRHSNWRFLRSSFTVNTAAADGVYLPEDCTDSRLAEAMTADGFDYWREDTFRIYLTSAGVATQAWLPVTRDWDIFRDRWLFGSPGSMRPSTFAIRPDDDAFVLGATPDAIYTITGDYQRVAALPSADADELAMPARFHMAVVWMAVRSYAGFEEDSGLYDHANREYAKVNNALEDKELPGMTIAGPLV